MRWGKMDREEEEDGEEEGKKDGRDGSKGRVYTHL